MTAPVDPLPGRWLTALEAVQGVLDLMRSSSLPYDEWEPDAIGPHSNGYAMWLVGPPNFVDEDVRSGQMISTRGLTAAEILALIEARAAAQPGETTEQ